MSRRRSSLRPVAFSAIAAASFLIGTPALGDPIGIGTTVFSYSGTIVDVTVANAGFYFVTVYGADGGAGLATVGGSGAALGGLLNLTANEALKILVGGVGGTDGHDGGGGGGASFVVEADLSPLIIAAGGGGGNRSADNGGDATTLATSGAAGGLGGALAGGGGGGGGVFGNGGAGGFGSGSAANGSLGGAGLGGPSSFVGDTRSPGGFGGGGGGGFLGGGGGGGYVGGNGGNGVHAEGGAGGDSFLGLGITNMFFPGALNTLALDGDGEITFRFEGASMPPPVPEPASFAVLGSGLLGLLLLARRRRT